MEPFIPATFNLALNWTADLLFPVLLRAVQNINEVVITDEDKAMLRSLKKDRLLFERTNQNGFGGHALLHDFVESG